MPHSSRGFHSFVNVLVTCSAVHNTPILENGYSFPVPPQPRPGDAASSAAPEGAGRALEDPHSHATCIRKNCFWRCHGDVLIREHLLQQNQYICNFAKTNKQTKKPCGVFVSSAAGFRQDEDHDMFYIISMQTSCWTCRPARDARGTWLWETLRQRGWHTHM